MESVVKTYKLKGHQGAVTSLDHSSSLKNTPFVSAAACLLSGSEDGTARLWDLRENLRASMCIKAHPVNESEGMVSEVTSVSFAPTWKCDIALNETSVFAREYAVYIAVGPALYAYDLRNARSPIVALDEANLEHCSDDEVNHISLSNLRQGKPFQVSLADDAGRVTVLNQGTTESSTRILVHNDQALVTSAPFRPCYYKALQIASGGTDCTIKLWDSAKPRKPLDHLLIRPSDTNVNQVCNPPMINHLAWSPSGRLLAAALGDGSCALLQVSDNRSLVLASRIEDAHSGPVASIVFPRWSSQEGQNNNAVTAHDRLMCTVGNDGSLVLWDIGSSLCGDSATDPISLFPVIGESVHSQEACVDDMMMDKPKTLLGWTHGKAKPNWLVSSCSCDSVFPSALFLADTTNDITVYSVPTS